MITLLEYNEGVNHSDPDVRASIKIQIYSENGVDSVDYEKLVKAINDIEKILGKYDKENK